MTQRVPPPTDVPEPRGALTWPERVTVQLGCWLSFGVSIAFYESYPPRGPRSPSYAAFEFWNPRTIEAAFSPHGGLAAVAVAVGIAALTTCSGWLWRRRGYALRNRVVNFGIVLWIFAAGLLATLEKVAHGWEDGQTFWHATVAQPPVRETAIIIALLLVGDLVSQGRDHFLERRARRDPSG